MNDTNTAEITARQAQILTFIENMGKISSSEVFAYLKEKESVSLVTVKRELSLLEKNGFILKSGSGRSVLYSLKTKGLMLNPVSAEDFFTLDVDKRKGRGAINLDLFTPIDFEIFSNDEINQLRDATTVYQQRLKKVSSVSLHKEMERFVIELSWKSSKIEGNTYTLLDTENLLLNGVEAPGHSKDEAVMILNHKKAFKFVYDHQEKFKSIDRMKIEDVHKILIEKLGVLNFVRKGPVGITGSLYRPLDNEHQIIEVLEKLSKMINETKNPFDKSLLALVFISYIQPFEDGNKRTARLVSNAILLACGLAPLSYRTTDEKMYKEAMLVFYETNSIVEVKKIFIEQYIFSANNYLI